MEGPAGKCGTVGSGGPPGKVGKIGLPGPIGSKGSVGEHGEKGDKGDAGVIGPHGLVGLRGSTGLRGVQGVAEKLCFVKYHVSEDKLSIVESSEGVETLRNVSAYNEPTWHFDAKFVDNQEHTMANVQKAPGHGHFLEMKNSAYHCHYDLVNNQVNAIYIVYKIRDYDSTGTEHNYLFSYGMSDNHCGVCFLKDERTMGVYDIAGSPHYMDNSNFPTCYFNPC